MDTLTALERAECDAFYKANTDLTGIGVLLPKIVYINNLPYS